MAETFFITTAIDYTNGAPHIGHAYEKVLADVLARYHRLKGDDVFFLTGVDQHGQKVQQSAEKAGVEPQQYVDGITAKFRALWDKLNVRYDGWAATTDASHKECVRAILQRLWDDLGEDGQSKWIYKKSEGGYYSVRQEQFLTDKERGEDGEFGPEWQPVEFREEENFYFALLHHKQWLLDLIDARSAAGNPLVIPDFRVGELRNAVEKLEGDLCISRPATRLQWGIPFPESWGAGFVTYVWFDALVNYISFAPGYDPALASPFDSAQFRALWPALHVIGKDIMIPAHGVYWPIMLRALGFEGDDIPQLLVHGWWNISGAKMSKSLGNVIDPDQLADKYGAEAVRYYLVSDIATGKDADFSEERLIQRYNTDLANSLGNLLNRSLNMAAKFRAGKITRTGLSLDVAGDAPILISSAAEKHDWAPGTEVPGSEVKRSFSEYAVFIVRGVARSIEGHRQEASQGIVVNYPSFRLELALETIGAFVTQGNQLVDREAPWKLAKDPAQAERLDAVLYTLAESLRIIAILLSPVLPQAAQGIFDQLNWKMDEQGHETRFRLAEAVWGGLPDGHQLGTPTPLFPRIETPKD
jgi:methionyl-tRNA synthetase